MDLAAALVHFPGREDVSLTAKELELLRTLERGRGRIVTIDQLCEALWEGELYGYENALMVNVRRLREKVEVDPSHPRYIQTVRGLGYRLTAEERR